MATRILAGETERIQTPALLDGALNEVTGLSTVVLGIQRTSDGYWYDFDDDTFRNSGWTTRQQQMTETSAAYAPGEYHYDWNTNLITNAIADDSYMIRVDETGDNANNTPFSGEIKIDQWVKDIVDDANAIESRLPSDPADQSLVETAITAAQAAIITQGDAAWITATGFAVAGDAMTLTAAERTAIDSALSATHGSGAWDGTLSGVQATRLNEIWYRLGLDVNNELVEELDSAKVPADGSIIDLEFTIVGTQITTQRQ